MTAGTIRKVVILSLLTLAVAGGIELVSSRLSRGPFLSRLWHGYIGRTQDQTLALPAGRNVDNLPGPRKRLIEHLDRTPADGQEGLAVLPAAGQAGSSTTISTSMIAARSASKTSTTAWQNTLFAPQAGAFALEFDAVPNAAGIDALTALSAGAIATPSDVAIAVRFNANNTIDARNGSLYAAATAIPYSPGTSYHFRLVIDVPAHTYSVYVMPAGGAEQALGADYSFRTEQAGAWNLANWGLFAGCGTHTVSGMRLGLGPLGAEAGQAVIIAAGISTTLSGLAYGGVPPYTYGWSPATGLSDLALPDPVASPTLTTTYTFRATDSAGNTATDTVTVTVVTGAPSSLSASAGGGRTITAGGSTTLSGSATGGTPPYSCCWSPANGLSSTAGPSPMASPLATTTYTLTVRDAVGRIAADSATVTVTPAAAGTVYYVSPGGSDAGDGSAAAPWKTLARAAATASAGSTVVVRAGTYAETIRPANSGTADALITFMSETLHGAILDGHSNRDYGVDMTRPASYIRIDGFEIRDYTADGIILNDWYSRLNRGIQVFNCYIHNNAGDGLNFRNSQDSLAEGNEIVDNGQTAAAIGGQVGSTNLVIRSNRIHHNVKDGIQGQCMGLLVEYNALWDQFFSDAHQDAFQLDAYDNVTIRYNLIGDFTQLVYGGPATGEVGLCKDLTVYGNVFYNSGYWKLGGSNGGNGTCPAVYIDCSAGAPGAVLTGTRIFNNTFLYLGDDQKPIELYGNATTTLSDVRICNNVFYQCRGNRGGNTYGLDAAFTGVKIDYNCYYNMLPMAGQDGHSLRADPRFGHYTQAASIFDVHLQAGSPCIDAGAPDLGSLQILPSPFLDMDGVVRPQAAVMTSVHTRPRERPAMGAFLHDL